jgi:outer membrane lipoprotein SlyB
MRLAHRTAFVAAGVLLALSGCSPDISPDKYATAATQKANKVDQGVVVGVRRVTVTVDGNTGAVAGAAAGGVVGSQMPGSQTASALGAVGGGVLGGLLGSSVEKATGDTKAWEYIVRKTNDELVSVTQADATPLAVGQNVLVINGVQARIVPDYTVKLPDAKAEAKKEKPKDADKPADAAAAPATVVIPPLVLPSMAQSEADKEKIKLPQDAFPPKPLDVVAPIKPLTDDN